MNKSSTAMINKGRVRVYDAAGKLTDEFNYVPLVSELPQNKWIWIVITEPVSKGGQCTTYCIE